MNIEDSFEAAELDSRLWLPYYLPQWSSREAARARFAVGGGALRLRIDEGQPEWCPEFDAGVRVSSLQTGVFAGPLHSAVGQHRFRPHLVVREEQKPLALVTPKYGHVEIRARAVDALDCMVALWMIGYEDEPDRSGEICVMEIFGRDVHRDHTIIGMGIHPFADPSLRDDFTRERVGIDARDAHTYAVDWTEGAVRYLIDDTVVRESTQSPAYPMQMMLGIYQIGNPQRPGAYPKEFVVERFRVDGV